MRQAQGIARLGCLRGMTQRESTGADAPPKDPLPGRRPLPQPRLWERRRSSLMFDLTVLREEQETSREPGGGAPTVYYLATTLPVSRPSSPWRTVLGFGAVILAGVGLGLLLAVVLL